MKLSLCVIVRDEAVALPLMLESAKDFVDEIVIVDTGSTDGTPDVARRYTDKVFFREWDNSFANARNFSLEQATGEWILILDADETLDRPTWFGVRDYLATVATDMQAVMPTMVMCTDSGVPYQEFLCERIVRNDPSVRFSGEMHNWLEVTPEARISIPNVRIIHNRGVKPAAQRAKRADQRLEMAEAIFLPKIAENPKDRRSIFYLAGTYFDSNRYEDAIKWYTEYLQVSDWAEERYQAALLLGYALISTGQRDRARNVIAAYTVDNYRRAEAYCVLGDLALGKGDFAEAESWYKQASLKSKPADPMFVEVDAHTWRPLAGLFKTYASTGDIGKAGKFAVEALQLGAPADSGVPKWLKNHRKYRSQRIACFVDRGQINFLQPLVDQWQREGKDVWLTSEPDQEIYEWADVIWCEWAGPLAEWVTHLPHRCRVILRVHGYELFSGLLPKVAWENVDDVIFVANYLREMAARQVPHIEITCNAYTVAGGVETGKFGIANGKTGKKVAMLGFVSERKNIPLALQILAKCPEHELHIGGEWQDPETEQYVRHLIAEQEMQDRVFIEGPIDDLNDWFADKDFILSTSTRETFHYALAEGMAAGLKPVIHCWQSASDFYPSEYIFATVDEAVAMLSDVGQPSEYRDYAVRLLDIEKNIRRVRRILERPAVTVNGEPKFADALEWKLLLALESIGCRTDAPTQDLVILTGHAPRVEPWMVGAKTILWHREQVIGDNPYAEARRTNILPVLSEVDVVVTYNPLAVDWYKTAGAKRVGYLDVVAAVSPFRKIAGIEKQFDVGFCGIVNERRDKILAELGKKFKVQVLNNFDHEAVCQFYNACKIVVNLHYTDELSIENRPAEAMACGTCVVSEPLPERVPGVLETEDLALGIQQLLDHPEEAARLAKYGYDWVWREARLEQKVEALLEMGGL